MKNSRLIRQLQRRKQDNINLPEIRRKFEETRAQFILSELNLAITFCEIASSTRDSERAQRNRWNARQALESATHFLVNARVTSDEQGQISEKLRSLSEMLAKMESAAPSGEAPVS